MLDAHCHLDRYSDPAKIAAEARRRGVFIVAVTTLPSHFRLGQQYVRALAGVRLGLGLHPLVALEGQSELPLFRDLLAHTSFVGEVGIDLSREGVATSAQQLKLFDGIAAALGKAGPKFISLHSRGAVPEVLATLERHRLKSVVFHWFSGTVDELQAVLQAGHYLSVNPAMTRSASGRRLLSRIPRDRVLTESDGPYTRLHGRPAMPWDVEIVERYLADLWGSSVLEVRSTIWANFCQIVSAIRTRNVRSDFDFQL